MRSSSPLNLTYYLFTNYMNIVLKLGRDFQVLLSYKDFLKVVKKFVVVTHSRYHVCIALDLTQVRFIDFTFLTYF